MSNPSTLRLTDGEARHDEAPGFQVAFATSDMETVDQHFGSATRFARYRVDGRGCSLFNLTRFDEAAHDGNESKLPARIAALEGCAAVFCLAVGGSAVRQLLAAGIQPVKLEPGASVAEVLEFLRGEITRATTPWVVKALRGSRAAHDARRFDVMETEGWVE